MRALKRDLLALVKGSPLEQRLRSSNQQSRFLKRLRQTGGLSKMPKMVVDNRRWASRRRASLRPAPTRGTPVPPALHHLWTQCVLRPNLCGLQPSPVLETRNFRAA